jgi:hypothetical protein
MLSYAGHGGKLPDKNSDEEDFKDETWCLFDGELVDDELYYLLSKFAAGVRVIVISDSCHSGTVTRTMLDSAPKNNVAGETFRYRDMPTRVAIHTYHNNKDFYDAILRDVKLKITQDQVKASVLLISGCQDDQLSADGEFNGLFTAALLQTWDDGKFHGDYGEFHRRIVNQMPKKQKPNYFFIGQPNSTFEKQNPFTL